MKTNILVTGVVLATVGAVLLYPTIRGNAAGTPPPRDVIAPLGAKRVEVVFVLDTTGSMGGLIHAAKEKIWSIASTLAQAQQAPEISMGLVAYRDRGDAYVTQVVDLNRDLDSMYAKLMDFAADGGGDGPEAVNEALEAAIHRMSWSQDQSTYKVVFLVGDAPPHMDYQDDVKYPQVVAAAAAKGIVVNTIQCGSMSDTVAPWQHIASLGPRALLHRRASRQRRRDRNAVRRADRDARGGARRHAPLLRLGRAASRDGGESRRDDAPQRRSVGRGARAARRVQRQRSRRGQLLGRAASSSTTSRAAASTSPPFPPRRAAGRRRGAAGRGAARSCSPKRRRSARSCNGRSRRSPRSATRISRTQVDAAGGADDSLDQQIYDAVREQAAPLGLDYEDGPRF